MANPTRLSFNINTVTLAATNVTRGYMSRHWQEARNFRYYYTYRTTGAAAPTLSAMEAEMIWLFQNHPEQENIESSSGIDVYVLAGQVNTTTDQAVIVVAI